MTVAQLNTFDRRTRDTVLQQLEWDASVDASAIGVAAKDSVVTLTGYVDAYAEKLAAERVAKGVRGVRAIANDIEVRPMLGRTDADIASDAVRALEARGTVPFNVQLAVHNARITLTGRVRRLFHKTEAEKAVRRVKGVLGIFNHIDVANDEIARDVRHRIIDALHRHADLDPRQIFVTVEGNVVTLAGTVTTWFQRETAERAAADAPGVACIENHIAVMPPVEPVDELC